MGRVHGLAVQEMSAAALYKGGRFCQFLLDGVAGGESDLVAAKEERGAERAVPFVTARFPARDLYQNF